MNNVSSVTRTQMIIYVTAKTTHHENSMWRITCPPHPLWFVLLLLLRMVISPCFVMCNTGKPDKYLHKYYTNILHQSLHAYIKLLTMNLIEDMSTTYYQTRKDIQLEIQCYQLLYEWEKPASRSQEPFLSGLNYIIVKCAPMLN